MAANSGTTISGTAGAAVTPAPSVIVRDQNGSPFAGATITFAVSSGGGSVSATSAVTDASGVASVNWTLGTTAGSNVLTATSGNLSVTFTATGAAGPAAVMVISSGNNQVGAAAGVLPISPAVSVQDANGNAKSGAAVIFTVGVGGGSITGGNAITNGQGIATVGSWTLGATAGPNTLVATTPGVLPVTFSATATFDKCSQRVTHVLGTTTQGLLESDDCQFIDGTFSDGTFIDFYSTTLSEANAYFFRQASTAFDSYVLLKLSDGTIVAENNDERVGNTDASIKAILPAGNYILGANSFVAGATGPYTLSSSIAPSNNGNCELVFVVKNITTSQAIEATDCPFPVNPPVFADGYFILLKPGQSVTVQMSSSVVDSFLQIVRNSDRVTVAQNDNRDATTKDAQLTFTATVLDYYAIFARTAVTGQTGAYILTIQ
jgi:hypothetical protein